MVHETDLSRVDLNLLVVFEAVFAEAHVGRAAERLNLSTSAVSHSLGRLRRVLNDPLFLKTPKGVVPSERATALAPGIAEALRHVRAVISRAEPFDPATSTRRLVIGAPDGVAAVLLHPLLREINLAAPGIDIGVRQLLPVADEKSPDRVWRNAFLELEARSLDVAIIPSEDAPPRFHREALYQESFVLVMSPDHPYRATPTVEAYCASRHLVVSHSGDPHGFVDAVLDETGLKRRVALTLPNFMFACAVLADSDLICALPRRFAAQYARRMRLAIVDPPLSLGQFTLHAVFPRSALADAGLQWLLACLTRASAEDGHI